MKTLLIISAMLLALSSCTKEVPAPDPTDNASVYTNPDTGTNPDDSTDPDTGTNPDTNTNPDTGTNPDGGSTCPY